MPHDIQSELPAWCVSLLPAHIFWRFHQKEKKVELISTGRGSISPEIILPLLSDLRFASTLVASEDFIRFKYFIQHLRQGISDQLNFRLIDHKGQWRFGRLASITTNDKPHFVTGCFFDFTDLIPSMSPNKPSDVKSKRDHSISNSKDVEKQIVSLPALLADLCRQQQQTDLSLFDALAIVYFDEDNQSKRWISHGFDGESPKGKEIDQLILYLKNTFSASTTSPLIVNNTLSSHQPLDWAVFVRRGVLSYWIEPITNRRRVKGAIIFASRKPWRYNPDQIGHLQETITLLSQFQNSEKGIL